jgi:hypothetical protein
MPANPNIFKKYRSDIFYESGTYLGDGIRAAIEAGYPKIVSVEIFEPIYKMTRQKFVNYPQVACFHGDTVSVLNEILPSFKNKKVTFWLDGHYSGPGTGGEHNPFPIIEELQEILKAKNDGWISHPTILIDDMRLLMDREKELISIMKEIEPTYIFEYEDGGSNFSMKNDILVAK